MLVKNDIGPISLRGLLGFVIVAAVIIAGGFVLYKQFRKAVFPAPVDATKCAQDDNYHYKDPTKHPQDC